MTRESETGLRLPEGDIPENNFWKGPDLKTLQNVRLLPGKTSKVGFIVEEDSLPKAQGNYRLDGIEISMRSRAAQLGVEVVDCFPEQFEQGLQVTPDGHKIMNVILQNHTPRPIFIPENSGVFRFYKDGIEHAISGRELYSLIGNTEKHVLIEGEKGVDWDFHLDPKTKRVDGVYLRIGKENRRYIKESSDIIDFPTQNGEYRPLVDRYYESIPQTEEPILWVGETGKLSLPEGIEAILSHEVTTEIKGKVIGRHIDSRLIDGGKTNWKIRTEVISKTTEDEIANFAIAHFVRSGIPQAA